MPLEEHTLLRVKQGGRDVEDQSLEVIAVAQEAAVAVGVHHLLAQLAVPLALDSPCGPRACARPRLPSRSPRRAAPARARACRSRSSFARVSASSLSSSDSLKTLPLSSASS